MRLIRRWPAAHISGVLLSGLCALSGISDLSAREVPYLSGRVMDETRTLSQTTLVEITRQLQEHEARTSNQMVVLIIASLDGEDLESYSHRVAETWQLGQAAKDNGVLLLIVKSDRKLRLEVGYGLEDTLTDLKSKHILDYEIVPHFKQGDYDAGVQAGVQATLGVLEGTYEPATPQPDRGDLIARILFGIPFLGIFFFVVGIFTLVCLSQEDFIGWFLYAFLIPFWFAFPSAIFGWDIGQYFGYVYLGLVGSLKLYMKYLPGGRSIYAWLEARLPVFVSAGKGGGFSGSSSGGSSGGWSSSSSSSFSGGGGSFGGGGSSSSW